MTRDVVLVLLGILIGLLIRTAIDRPWRRPVPVAARLVEITPGPRPTGPVTKCPDCVAGVAVWTGPPGSRKPVECGTCDGTAVIPARARMWLRPGARVVDRAGAIGTVLDPATAYVPLGKLITEPRPWGDGRWPVRFDADPNTIAWHDAADLDPVTPADEEVLAKTIRAPRFRSL